MNRGGRKIKRQISWQQTQHKKSCYLTSLRHDTRTFDSCGFLAERVLIFIFEILSAGLLESRLLFGAVEKCKGIFTRHYRPFEVDCLSWHFRSASQPASQPDNQSVS